MKFDDHLASYLYEYKSLMLEGIGTFTLDEKIKVSNQQGKEVYYPNEGLSFKYNPRSSTDEEIIFFLVKKLGKIEPLIRSDIESYLYNIKIFLNIGNPYTIEGIGTLNKNNQGIYEFTPGNFSPAKETLNPLRENADHNYPVRSKSSAGRVLVIVLIVISAIAALGGLGWAIFNFTIKQSATHKDGQGQEQTFATTGQTDAIVTEKDTASVLTKTPIVSSPLATVNGLADPSDSVQYKMIFEITKSKERAYSRTDQLNSLHSYTQYDSIPINDTVAYYRLFLMIKINPADTTRVKDSLQILFGKKIFMEKQID